jgi:ornithine cyclodeaminase/alanine dehydrogenase
MRTLLLTGDDVRALLGPELAVRAVERAFDAHGRGETIMPPKVYLPLPQHDGDFRGMPVYLDGYAGIKWVNAHPNNARRHGIPSVLGVFILSDAATAVPLAIMDATGLTAMRTGAAAAVATKHLARSDARTLGIIGCGAQARTVVACLPLVMTVGELLLYDRDAAAAARLASETNALGARVVGLTEAAGADVVCTLTPSRAPIVGRTAVRAGTHINAMGADAPGKQELDIEILLAARVFLDDWGQAPESGEVNVALHSGRLRREAIAGSLGEVVAGKIPGRLAAGDITVFDSTGLAVQDLAVAREIYERARATNAGMELELVRP